MIENIPPKGVSFSDLICKFAMSYQSFACFFRNTKISENSDMAKSWATFCCSPPALFGDVLEYEGKFYKVGTVRQEVKDSQPDGVYNFSTKSERTTCTCGSSFPYGFRTLVHIPQ